ncbi:MAG: hypothetical protein M3R02_27500 [Chloroflexota bacterium]|nr:hypothetical protein [Chloroflexota bacterium]
MDADPLHRHGNSGAIGPVRGLAAHWTTVGTRRLSRIALLVVAATQAALVAFAVPALFAERRTPPPATDLGLTRLGLTPSFYAAYVTFVLVAFAVGCFGVAALVAGRRADGMAQLTVLLLVLMGAANAPNATAVAEYWPSLKPVGRRVHVSSLRDPDPLSVPVSGRPVRAPLARGGRECPPHALAGCAAPNRRQPL